MASKARGGRVGWFKRFLHWLTTSARSSHRKAHPDLNPIDVDKLARELNLRADAKELGAAGVPAADAIALTGPEATVVQRVEQARQDYMEWAALRLATLGRDLSRSNVTAEVNRARQADAEFERKASTIISEHDSVLRRLADAARMSKDELAAFKVQNKLTREARFPVGQGVVWRYLLLVLFIGLEAIFNASLFATGLDDGLIGGAFQAGIAAAVNVGFAFWMGRKVFPYAFHSNPWIRCVGLAALLLVFAGILVCGLGIAHYRDALSSDMADAASAAHQAFFSNPFGLKPGASWALLAVSVAFGIAALLDGLSLDDRYPGYGDVARRAIDAVEAYDEELGDLRDRLEELKDDELKNLDRVVESSQAAVAVFETTIRDKQSAGTRLQQLITQADYSLEALLQVFRTENERHRAGLPRPRYFDTYPSLRSLSAPNFDTVADTAVLEEQRGLVKALLDESEDLRGRIQAAFSKRFDQLSSLDVHFPTEGAT